MTGGALRVERAADMPAPGEAGLFWLGQAGFWIETGAHRLLIDPYLSDSLARKYAGKPNDHRRMAPAPVAVGDLPRPDLVLVTHDHTDHLDPDTLGPPHRRFPDLRFMVPAAADALARERIGPDAPLIPVDADDVLTPLAGLTVTVFPAPHETLERDPQGRHRFLGYGIDSGGLRLWHSGDCIPYPGLEARVAAFDPQLCLLPVNGRDEARKAAGVPGNFHLGEAVAISGPDRYLVPHRFGMFAFNTADPAAIDAAAAGPGSPRIVRPILGQRMALIR